MSSPLLRCTVLIAWAVLILNATATLPAFAETPPTLGVDPFRPLPQPGPPAALAPEQAVFTPILRSTVVSGDRSLANLGGEILSPGEKAHGFELVEVRAFDALFRKDGELVRLEVFTPPDAPTQTRAETLR